MSEDKKESGFYDLKTGKPLSLQEVEWRMNRPDKYLKVRFIIATIAFALFTYWFFFDGGQSLIFKGLIP